MFEIIHPTVVPQTLFNLYFSISFPSSFFAAYLVIAVAMIEGLCFAMKDEVLNLVELDDLKEKECEEGLGRSGVLDAALKGPTALNHWR